MLDFSDRTRTGISILTSAADLWKEISTKAHVRGQAAARRNVAPQQAATREDNIGGMNLVAELKPEVPSNDATAGELRIWLKKFEAYYLASNMQVARIQVHQAYLRNCLDNALTLQLDSYIQQTTPVIGGGVSCISNLSAIFQRKYPPLLRKQFFSMSQQPGQNERAFLESLKAAASEADMAGMTLQDALCIMLVTVIRDTRLKEKLSELEEPTLPTLSILIDAHLHAKATAGSAASINKVYSPKNGNKKAQKGGQGQRQAGSISESEKKRRTIMKGKCYM